MVACSFDCVECVPGVLYGVPRDCPPSGVGQPDRGRARDCRLPNAPLPGEEEITARPFQKAGFRRSRNFVAHGLKFRSVGQVARQLAERGSVYSTSGTAGASPERGAVLVEPVRLRWLRGSSSTTRLP